MSTTMWDEKTYPFPNFSGSTVEDYEWTINSIHTLQWVLFRIHAGFEVDLY